LGYTEDEFLEAFGANVNEQNESALENSPVAQAVLAFVEEISTWEGTPAETLAELNMAAERLRIDMRARTWPKSPSALTRRLNEVRPNLMRVGIAVETGHTGRQRTIAFKGTENAVSAVNRFKNAVRTNGDAVKGGRFSTEGSDSESPPDNSTNETNGILAGVEGPPSTIPLWEQEIP
jgi:hypothetical protein